MLIEFDPVKDAANYAKHGVLLTTVEQFEWGSALISADARSEYGEARFVAYGLIGTRVHCLVYTVRGSALRIISLRRANQREVKRYEHET